MSMKYLGKRFDIHTGGEDNIFPHHENEIAQSEAATGQKPFVKYWVHIRHLLVEGEKMAKSKGNFYTLRDLEKMGYPSLAFRVLVLGSHYRNKLNFTFRGLKQAKKNLERVAEFIENLNKLKRQKSNKKTLAKFLVLKTEKEFEKAMDDDFNTPMALVSIFRLINRGNQLFNQEKLTPADARDILNLLKKFDKVLGFIFQKKPKKEIPKEVLKLVKEREKYRKEGQWELADKIREKIKKMGYWVEDTKEGSKIKIFS